MKAFGLFLWLVVLNCGTPFQLSRDASGQKSAYDGVPGVHRKALADSVERMVYLQRTRQWAKIYDLLDKNDRTDSKDNFVRKASRGPKLLAFSPKNATHSPIHEDEWLIVGCGTFLRNGTNSSWESILFGRLAGDKWSVSMVLLSGGEDQGLTSCRAT